MDHQENAENETNNSNNEEKLISNNKNLDLNVNNDDNIELDYKKESEELDLKSLSSSKSLSTTSTPSLSSSSKINDIDNEGEKLSDEKNNKFINKLTSRVEEYINQCFEMEDITQANEFSKQDNNETMKHESTMMVNVEKEIIINDKKLLRGEQPLNKVMTLPAIHITNEYGQESISIDTNNHFNYNNELQQPQQVAKSQDPQHRPKVAVVLKNVSFSYTKRIDVLSNINLIIPKAKIFALLGSSGCGKTTLLKIILGRLPLKKGDVLVFGARPGSVHSNIPGSGVGFMPQELAMMPNFTIEEILYYFGLMHHIPKTEIKKRTDFMIELLNLPPKDRKIEQCSGGQQRRTSIALTLFHSPPLLILDEPTVGVDPLLRQKIWQYLEYLCVNNRMTIIITTHYIEESRRANNLAFMRFGRILSQDTPESLLSKYQTNILEDVFLKLCQHDCGDIKQKHSIKKVEQKQQQEVIEMENEPIRSKYYNFTIDRTRMKASLFKNLITVKRNPYFILFFLFLPVIQIILFCISVYKSPDNISISVYNADEKGLSKKFLNLINNDLLNIKYYNSLDEAIQTVVDGKAWVAVTMNKNFSIAYRRRAKNPSDLIEEDFNNSKILLYTDQTDNFIMSVIKNSFTTTYQMFVEDIAQSFGYNPSTVQIPIYMKEIIYGHTDLTRGYELLNNLVAGALICIIYTTPLILAGMVIVIERKDQVIERIFVNGVTAIEIFLTHLITLLTFLLFQVIILLFVVMTLFEVKNLGSIYELFIFIYLQGMTGVLIGLLLSIISKNEMIALLLSFGCIFPVWMMSGVFWPLESIDPWLQNIFWLLPLSYPIRSTSHIFKRGWTYEQYEVKMGYLNSFLYNSFLLIVNILLFHFTSK